MYIYFRWLLACLLSVAPAAGALPAEEQTVYRWVDDAGRLHLGDRPPGVPAETLKLPRGQAANEGLRPGERNALKRIGRRLARQRREARARHADARHRREQRRQTCRERRTTLEHSRNAERRKALVRHLRSRCW